MLQRKSLIAFRVAVSAVFFTLLFTFLLPAIGKAQTPVKEHEGHQMPATSLQQETMPALTLNDLEAMALKNNPTLAQSEAALRAVEGQRVQAGLYPNPIIGYQGEGFSTRAFNQQSAHAFYIEQEIPLGGKLSKSRNIFAFGKTQAGFTAEAQKQRVLNAVRMLYYEALGAQQLIEVRTQLTKLGRDAVNVTGELFNVGQADRPDVLEIEVEAQRTQLDLLMAENERTQIWQQLGALVGNPMLKPTPLSGELGRGVPQLEQETLLARLLTESPEIKRAQTGIEKAKAVVTRAKAEMAPNLFVRGGWGYSNETLELRNQTIVKPPGAVGPQGFAQVGIRIPIFNRNQGGIATAQAELNIAEQNLKHASGHLLPVLLHPTPFAHLPAFVKSVTVLEIPGDLVASVADAVHRLAVEWRSQRWRRVAGAGPLGLTMPPCLPPARSTSCAIKLLSTVHSG